VLHSNAKRVKSSNFMKDFSKFVDGRDESLYKNKLKPNAIFFSSSPEIPSANKPKKLILHIPEENGIVMQFKERSGDWCVAQVSHTGYKRGYFEVVGVMKGLQKGKRYKFVGEIIKRKYGQQLEVISFSELPSLSELECLPQYLRDIPGVGDKLAGRIIDHLGDKTLDVIFGVGNDLHHVNGISKTLAMKIVKFCLDHQALWQVHLRLAPVGIPLAVSKKILASYEGKAAAAIDIIEHDPYSLCRQVTGVTFHMADNIAISNPKLDCNGLKRIDAGVSYVLEMAGRKGHTAQPLDEVEQQTIKLLATNETKDRPKVAIMLENGDLPNVTCHDVSGKKFAQLTELDKDEQTIADFFRRSPTKGRKVPPAVLARAARQCGFETFSASQIKAITAIVENLAAVVTGGPGCGKSSIIPAVLSVLDLQGVGVNDVKVIAPTGRAAQRINEMIKAGSKTVFSYKNFEGFEATTIHRLLTSDIPNTPKVVIVDETSMLSTELAAKLIRALPTGCRLVFIGDKDQLPSIDPGDVLSHIIGSKCIPTITLETVYRQASYSSIVEVAKHINEGKFEKDFLDALPDDNQFQFVPLREDQSITRLLHDIMTKLPKRYGPKDVQILAPMRKGDHGIAKTNTFFQEMNDGEEATEHFKIGDKVMQTRNNYDLGVFNGTVGILTAFSEIGRTEEGRRGSVTNHEAPEPPPLSQNRTPQRKSSRSTKSGDGLASPKTVLENDRDREVYLTVDFDGELITSRSTDFDLDLAYASTIHKSQGSEYPVVILVLTKKHAYMLKHTSMLRRKLFYTAATRPKEKLIIVGDFEACKQAASDNRTDDRCCLLRHKLLK